MVVQNVKGGNVMHGNRYLVEIFVLSLSAFVLIYTKPATLVTAPGPSRMQKDIDLNRNNRLFRRKAQRESNGDEGQYC